MGWGRGGGKGPGHHRVSSTKIKPAPLAVRAANNAIQTRNLAFTNPLDGKGAPDAPAKGCPGGEAAVPGSGAPHGDRTILRRSHPGFRGQLSSRHIDS